MEVGEGAEQLLPPAADPCVAAVSALNSGEAREGLHVEHGGEPLGVGNGLDR